MKYSSCCKPNGQGLMFHPTLISVVAGVIMMTAGAGKFIAGSDMMSGLGGSVLGLFGLDASAGGLLTLALVLGYTAATIELLGGLIFAVGSRKAGKYAALALAAVMILALLTKFGRIEGLADLSMFDAFSKIITTIRLDLLLVAIFVQKSLGVFGCCKKSCCGSGKYNK